MAVIRVDGSQAGTPEAAVLYALNMSGGAESQHGDQVERERAPSTVNRDMAVLRAALSKVLSPGAPNSEAAWQEALKAIFAQQSCLFRIADTTF